MRTPEAFQRTGLRVNFKNICIASLIGVGVGSYAATQPVHDYLIYPQEVATQHTIDHQVADLSHDAGRVEGVLQNLNDERQLISHYHNLTMPPAISAEIDMANATIRQEKSRIAALQHERPSIPTVTEYQNWEAGIVLGGFFSATGVAIAYARRRSQKDVAEAALTDAEA